jgi:hypothetical protein
MRRAVITAVTTVALLGACSFGGDDPPSGQSLGAAEDVVDAGGLPQSCDELLTPLSVAAALNGEPAGGRSAAYTPPNSATGAVAGMTCSFGVSAGQAAVSVEAVAFSEPEQAADQFAAITRAARKQATSQESVEVGGAPGLLVRSAGAADYYVLDERRTLRFTASEAAVGADQAPDVLAELAQTVVDGISSTQPR